MGIAVRDLPKIKLVDLSDGTTIAASGGTNTQTLQPSAGYIYKVVELRYLAGDPSGSTAGTHRIDIKYQNMTYNMARIQSNTGSNVEINDTGFVGTTEKPSAANQQFDIIRGKKLIATNAQPLDFLYYNNTDANQTGTRLLELLVEETHERS